MRITSFEDLQVWPRSVNLVVDIYRLTGSFPKAEQFALTAQIRRAALSIPSNIAEGFCRRSKAAYINHLNIALGSEGELFTPIECARRLGLARACDLDRCFNELSQVGRMLRGLVCSLERSTRPQS